jgi:hypothetical protein
MSSQLENGSGSPHLPPSLTMTPLSLAAPPSSTTLSPCEVAQQHRREQLQHDRQQRSLTSQPGPRPSTVLARQLAQRLRRERERIDRP